jgi:hypothetical protein
VYTVDHVLDGIELLTGHPSGPERPVGEHGQVSVLGLAQKTLQAYRRACQLADYPKPRHPHGH